MELGFGPGEGARLLAPGVPEWIGTDGTRLGWLVRDRLFLLEGDRVRIVELPDVAEDACPSPTHWTIAHPRGFTLVDPVAGEVVSGVFEDERDPVATRPGADVGLVVAVPEHQLVRLVDGLPIPLPDGAIRARWIRPWARGPGACWVDLDVLYRLGPKIAALGRAPSPEAIAVGPEGATVVTLPHGTVVAAPRSIAVDIEERFQAEGARFSPDGKQALAASEDGLVLVDLLDGRVLRRWTGDLAPVGFAPDPIRLDGRTGQVLGTDDRVLASGFCGTAPAAADGRIAGPACSVWTVRGEVLRTDLPVGIAAMFGEHVAVADAQHIYLLDGASFPHGLCTDADDVRAVRLGADRVEIATLDGEYGAWQLDGTLIERKRDPDALDEDPPLPTGVALPDPDDESYIEDGSRRLPLPADGALRDGDLLLVWTDEGMLARA